MTKEDKLIVARWYILNKLIGVDKETYEKVRDGGISKLEELEEILWKSWDSTTCINCIRCIHISNTICNRCDKDDSGFRFRYKYYYNRMVEDGIWEREKELFLENKA